MTDEAAESTHRVVAAILVRDDTVLLCRRCLDRVSFPGVWDLPGGHVELDNETPAAALTRELGEELGISLNESPGEHSMALSAGAFEMRVWVLRDWEGSPANVAPEEHDEIGWFTAGEAQSLDLADARYRTWIAEVLAAHS